MTKLTISMYELVAPYCTRPSCSNQISLFTEAGILKTESRLKGQRYCCPSCARLHHIEVLRAEQVMLASAESMINKFLYSGPINDGQ